MRFIALALLLSAPAYASHFAAVCKDSVRMDPDQPGYSYSNPPLLAADQLIARKHYEGGHVVENFQGDVLLRMAAPISAVLLHEQTLWVLSGFDLLEYSLSGEQLSRHRMPNDANQAWVGRAMALAQDKIVIARGLAGLAAFDLNSRSFVWHTPMTEVDGGMPVAVAFDGRHLQVVMTNTRELGFSGVATVELGAGDVVRTTAYDQRRAGVVEPWARVRWAGNQLVLNNGGWVHVISAKQLAEGRPMKPRWVAQVVERDGEVNPHYMMLSGEFYLQGKTLVGCGNYTAQENGRFVRKGRVVEITLP